jgi:hypothetical protein
VSFGATDVSTIVANVMAGARPKQMTFDTVSAVHFRQKQDQGR